MAQRSRHCPGPGHPRRGRPDSAAPELRRAGWNAGPGACPPGRCSGRSPRRLCCRAPEIPFCHCRCCPPLQCGAARLLPLLVRGVRRRPWAAVAVAGAAVACCGGGLLCAGRLKVARRGDGLPAGGAGRSPGFTAACVLRPSRFPALSPPAPDEFNLAVGLLLIVGAARALLHQESSGPAGNHLGGLCFTVVLAAGPELAVGVSLPALVRAAPSLARFIADDRRGAPSPSP